MPPDKIHMPSGMGGLVRYFDEYKSKITFQPGHIIIIAIVIIVLMLILYSFGPRLLGL